MHPIQSESFPFPYELRITNPCEMHDWLGTRFPIWLAADLDRTRYRERRLCPIVWSAVATKWRIFAHEISLMLATGGLYAAVTERRGGQMRVPAAFAIAVALPATAAAQTTWVEIADQATVAPLSRSVDQVDDMDVYDASGKKIGEIEEVLGQNADTASALTVDFDDDAEYGGRDNVIVPLEMFQLDGERLILSADAEAMSSMEVWED
jgi:sporulation protein YlmC with PRC-barrel domain